LRRTVWAFIRCRTTTPAADFCRPVRMDRPTLSPDSGTNGRSPEVSPTAFRAQPPNLQPVPLMDMGLAVMCPLARRRMPQIRFLYIGSHVCSTLLSDPPRGDALALRYDFTSIRLSRGLPPPSCRTCSAHTRKGPPFPAVLLNGGRSATSSAEASTATGARRNRSSAWTACRCSQRCWDCRDG